MFSRSLLALVLLVGTGLPLSADIFQDAERGDVGAVRRALHSGAAIHALDPSGAVVLHRAASAGRKAVVELLLNAGASIDLLDREGGTALHRAVAGDHGAVVQVLLARKANVNARRRDGAAPLHVAASQGLARLAKLLLAAGADRNARDAAGRTPLECARAARRSAMEAVLAPAKPAAPARPMAARPGVKPPVGVPPVPQTPAQAAVRPQAPVPAASTTPVRPPAPIPAASTPARPQAPTPVPTAPPVPARPPAPAPTVTQTPVVWPGTAPLPAWLKAVAEGDLQAVRKALDGGADPNAAAADGATALHFAAEGCQVEMVKLLLERKAKVGAVARDGCTALHRAAAFGCAEAARLLLAAGADRNARDSKGRTPGELAQARGDRMLAVLVAPPPAVATQPPAPPLQPAPVPPPVVSPIPIPGPPASIFAAAAKGDLERVKTLLGSGTRVDAADADGATALHHAAFGGQVEVVILLLTRDANANARRLNGVTPLHVASALGRAGIARLLLAAGADRNARDLRGRTPRGLARLNYHPDVLAVLGPPAWQATPPVGQSGPPVGQAVLSPVPATTQAGQAVPSPPAQAVPPAGQAAPPAGQAAANPPAPAAANPPAPAAVNPPAHGIAPAGPMPWSPPNQAAPAATQVAMKPPAPGAEPDFGQLPPLPGPGTPPASAATGDVVLDGFVVTMERSLGRLWMRARSITAPDGTRIELSEPTCGVVLLGPGGRGNTPGAGKCSLQGLRPGSPVRATVTLKDPLLPRLLTLRGLQRAPGSAPGEGAPTWVPVANLLPLDRDGVSRARVAPAMVFPIVGRCAWSDTFLAPRGGGKRRHHGQDVMAHKMTPLVAVFDGTIEIAPARSRTAGNMLRIIGDNGFKALYMHMNNDTPGTNDGKGTARYCYAPGLRSGHRVSAGQLLGWVGDSGNAEGGAPHLHFEVHHFGTDAVVNPAAALRVSQRIPEPRADTLVSLPRPGQGEMRFEGNARVVDLAAGKLVFDLACRTDWRGKSWFPPQSERRRAYFPSGATFPLLGAKDLRVPLAGVSDGSPLILLGSETGTTVRPSRTYVALGGFVPDPALSGQLASLSVVNQVLASARDINEESDGVTDAEVVEDFGQPAPDSE